MVGTHGDEGSGLSDGVGVGEVEIMSPKVGSGKGEVVVDLSNSISSSGVGSGG